jgi:hypothetical protein
MPSSVLRKKRGAPMSRTWKDVYAHLCFALCEREYKYSEEFRWSRQRVRRKKSCQKMHKCTSRRGNPFSCKVAREKWDREREKRIDNILPPPLYAMLSICSLLPCVCVYISLVRTQPAWKSASFLVHSLILFSPIRVFPFLFLIDFCFFFFSFHFCPFPPSLFTHPPDGFLCTTWVERES